MKGTLLLELKLLPPHVWADDLLKQLLPPRFAGNGQSGHPMLGFEGARLSESHTMWASDGSTMAEASSSVFGGPPRSIGSGGRSGEEGSKLC